ncbi:MAG: hypothetical protein IJF33_07855 [Clostridia bacterium]|nr:hypothetical protein [Clostridia bacterium]
MNTERREMHATVREGYQILLRANVTLFLPIDKPKICKFYQKTAKTCIQWAETVCGERLREEFLSLETMRERSQFRTRRYEMHVHCVWEDGLYAAFLCESEITGEWKLPQKSYRRMSQVWNLQEETVLPFGQILRNFGFKLRKDMLPFRPDGIYPEGNQIVFFRNSGDHTSFLEKKLPREHE